MIDQMLEVLALAQFGRPDVPVDFGCEAALPEAIVTEAARLLPGTGIHIAVAPGSGRADKCWPLDRFIALGNCLVEQGRVPVFLLGPEEREWLSPLRGALPHALFPLAAPDARLELEPLLTIGLAARCQACVANDSGTGHLFAVSGVPLVSLFGPTSPLKFAARTPHLTTIEATTFGGSGMDNIPVEAVETAVTRAVAANASPP